MDQVVVGMSLLRPPALSATAFKALIRQRGWRMADAAVRWNIRPETLSRVAADPTREVRWDDMARALPPLTRRERAAATAARLALYPPRPRRPASAGDEVAEPGDAFQADPSASAPRHVTPFQWHEDLDGDDEDPGHLLAADGFRYQDYVGLGSELAVVSEIGSFAREGAFLMVIDTRLGIGRHGEALEEYLCESREGATLWLSPDLMDDWVVSTGRMRQGF